MSGDWRSAAREGIRERLEAILFPSPRFLNENFPSADSYQERLRRRKALFGWIIGQDFDFAVTMQFGEDLDDARVAAAVRRFAAILDHYWLGRHWCRYQPCDRTFFVGTVEEGPKRGNTHVHLLLRLPPSVPRSTGWRRQEQSRCYSLVFSDLGRRKGVCPRGDIRFDLLRDEYDKWLATSYALKDVYDGRDVILAGAGI